MSRHLAILLIALTFLAACAAPQKVEANAAEVEARRLEISGDQAAPTPFPDALPPSEAELQDPPAVLSMSDQLGTMCQNPGPVANAQPYSLTSGIHPIWVVDLFSDPGATAPAPVWLTPEWSASDASTVEMVACVSLVPVGDPIPCGNNMVVGSFVAIDLYLTSSGVQVSRFSNATEPQCADFVTTAYLALDFAGHQIVANLPAINDWLRPIVEIP